MKRVSLFLIVCLFGLAVMPTASAGPNTTLPAGVYAVDNNPAKPTFGNIGAQTGRTWAAAFDRIQDAIDQAYSLGGGEIWVADGVYSENRPEAWGAPSETGSLVLKDNTETYGGFLGYDANWYYGNEQVREHRSVTEGVSVIDGATSRSGNPAFHVVAVGGFNTVTSGVVLDGFQITGGVASSSLAGYHRNRGGGVYIYGCSPVIRNCTISGNVARVSGGGMSIEYNPNDSLPANPIIENCVFYGNTADRLADTDTNPIRGGGAIFVNATDTGRGTMNPVIRFCTFNANVAGNAAYTTWGLNSTGMYQYNSSPIVTHSIFWQDAILNQGPGSGGTAFTGGASVTYTDVFGGYSCPAFSNETDPSPAALGYGCGTQLWNQNPQFLETGPRFPLTTPGSPVVNAGDPALLAQVPKDIQGLTRTGNPDFGAYEGNGVLLAPVAGILEAAMFSLLAYAPQAYTFNNLSGNLGSLPVRIAWDIDDSGTEDYSVESPSHTYTPPGTYTARIYLSNGLGTSTDSVTIDLRAPVAVDGPTPLNPSPILSYSSITFTVQDPDSPRGGFAPPYNYQWQFSTDNVTWGLTFRDGDSLTNGAHTTTRPGRNPDIDPLVDPVGAYQVDVDYTITGAQTHTLTIDHALAGVHNGYFRCVVTDTQFATLGFAGGRFITPATQLQINQQLVILRDPQGGQFYEGNNESQDAVAFGGTTPQNYTYNWRLDGTPIDNSNVNPYNFVADPNPPTPSGLGWVSTTGSPGSYRVVVSDASIGGGAGVKQSASGVVEVEPAVDVTLPAATATRNTTQTFSMTASVTGGYPGYTWSWDWNGQPLLDGQPHPSGSGAVVSGATTDTISVSNLAQADAGTYTVTVVDSLGTDAKSSDTAAVVLSVTNNILVSSDPADADVYEGDTVSFEVTVGGGDPLTFEFDWKWDFGAGEITMPPAGVHPSGSGATVSEQLISANTHRLTLTGVGLTGQSDNGDYYCIIRDANPLNAEATSAAGVLGVYEPVQITSQPQSLNRYTGQSAVFSVQATGGIQDSRSFQWEVNSGLGWSTLLNSGNVSGATTNTLTVSPLVLGNNNTQYRCRVTAPASDVTSPNSNREQVSNAATLMVSGPLVVINDPIDVQAYVIDPPFTLKSEFEGGMPFGVAPLYQTDWRRTGVDPVAPEVSAGAGTLVIGNPNTASLQVTPGTLSPGFYDFRVELTDQVETTATASARVQIANSLNFDQPLQNAVTREGTSFEWSVVVSGGILPLTYQWQKQIDDGTKALVWVDVVDDATHNGTDTDTLEFTDVSFDDAGTYRVVVSDSGTQQITSSAQLVVENALPVGGGLGLMALAALSALGGALGIRRRR